MTQNPPKTAVDSDSPLVSRADSITPTETIDQANARYWISRHTELRGDIRATGNRGKSIEENIASYHVKNRILGTILEAEGGLLPGGSVIDLGCGVGMLGPALVSMGLIYTGVDVAPVALEQARERCPAGSYVEADILAYEPDRKFDVVLASTLLCHLVSDDAWHKAIALIKSLYCPN